MLDTSKKPSLTLVLAEKSVMTMPLQASGPVDMQLYSGKTFQSLFWHASNQAPN